MNFPAILALLMLSGQQAHKPLQPPKAALAAQRKAEKPADAGNITALLEAALQYSDGAGLEADRQLQCLQDTWSGGDDRDIDCAPLLVASQAQSALETAKQACGLLKPEKLTPEDKSTIITLLDKLSLSAAGTEQRAQKLAEASQTQEAHLAEAYEAGSNAAEAANELQEILSDTREILDTNN
ncbi:MAG TPA: hypothetical protein PLL10_10835 [Elusimicrobiales bacterium]|nr:hypothetical protein [Elusimicrobiales bacterium]